MLPDSVNVYQLELFTGAGCLIRMMWQTFKEFFIDRSLNHHYITQSDRMSTRQASVDNELEV